jgi:DnaJ-class molecular chaperone
MNDRPIENPLFSTIKCVVCNGFGSLKYGSVVCHGCKGRGYVVINNKTGFPVEEIDRKKENED